MSSYLDPGIYADIPARDYHADILTPVPSLSRSAIRTACDFSAHHLFASHPRLGGGGLDDDEESTAMLAGEAAHRWFLQGDNAVSILPFADYKTNAAKAAREAARAAGRIPLLAERAEDVRGMVAALEQFREQTGAFTDGKAEQTLIWQEGETWCRARVDWLPNDPAAPLWDLKSTGGAASSLTWRNIAFKNGADIQENWYLRGCCALRDELPSEMLFCVVEAKPPHGIRVFRMDSAGREIGKARVDYGLALWRRCMADGHWPSYPVEVEDIDPPWTLRSVWEPLTASGGALSGGSATARMISETGNWGG